MASDRQQFNRMEAHRETLLTEHQFSAAPDFGRMAIITMFNPLLIDTSRPANRPLAMSNEARRMRYFSELQGKPTHLILDATVEQFWEVLEDKSVSDIALIGGAYLNRVVPRNWHRASTPAKTNEEFTFFDAVSPDDPSWPSIDHLKTGAFYLRTCGSMNSANLNVPFAWGFMAERTNIWAPVQRGYWPSRTHLRPRAGLDNVADFFGLAEDAANGKMDYAQAKELFGQRENLRPRRYPVPAFLHPVYDRLRDNETLVGAHEKLRKRLSDSGVAGY